MANQIRNGALVRPVMFSALMVRALLDNQKTVTRRIVPSPLTKVSGGDVLYVREAFQTGGFRTRASGQAVTNVTFAAGGASLNVPWPAHCLSRRPGPRPAMHMPKACARVHLLVRSVKLECLHAMSATDAIAEGVRSIDPERTKPPLVTFQELWDSLHDKAGERWADNPLVVAVAFRKLTHEEIKNVRI